MKTICIIPARYASTRLPGKPLADICGRPMISRVYDRAAKARKISAAVVATDDERICAAVEKFGGKAILTRADHATGTDRLAEVVQTPPYDQFDLIINVQGDEPLIDPALIDDLAACFDGDDNLQMATVAAAMTEADEQKNPNNVKVVTDKNGYALYFSRSLIPYPRYERDIPVYKHIGIYAYRREFLLKYAAMPPTPLEATESLEQLRALENGYKIKVIVTNRRFVGVDTPEDLAQVQEEYKRLIAEGKEV